MQALLDGVGIEGMGHGWKGRLFCGEREGGVRPAWKEGPEREAQPVVKQCSPCQLSEISRSREAR